MTPSTRLTLLTLLSATATFCFFYKSRRRLLRLLKTPTTTSATTTAIQKGKILFISQTGTSKTLARRLHAFLTLNYLPFDLVDPKDYEPEDLHKETLILIVASTWEDGKPPPNGGFFVNWLIESADDFRVGSLLLRSCKFAVFGVGSRAYGDTFNAVGRDVSERLRKLGGNEILQMSEGDVDGRNIDEVFDSWCKRVCRVLKGEVVGSDGNFANGVGVGEESGEEGEESEAEEEENGGEEEIVDLEDLAGKGPSRKSTMRVEVNGVTKSGVKEMVTPVIRANLEKQVIFNILVGNNDGYLSTYVN